jgi:hypothetical protein
MHFAREHLSERKNLAALAKGFARGGTDGSCRIAISSARLLHQGQRPPGQVMRSDR